MSFSIRNFLQGFAALSLGLLTAAAFAPQASAQTAPQLLPYTVNVVGGGGATFTGTTCPVSGNTATDTYGDGCLATEIALVSPRYAVTDAGGNIFFTDYTASLVRRIDATTGIISLIAGSASTNPASGAKCGTAATPLATDGKGDGCMSNQVSLYDPSGLAFDAKGNLYFTDGGGSTTGLADVREVAATGGLITGPGVITLIAGSPTPKVNGYATNQGTTGGTGTIVAGSAAGLLEFPASIAFDAAGNLYIADEGNEALEVVNLTAATETIQGVSVPVGTIAKFTGYGVYQTKATTGECPNGIYTSSTARGGCYFGTYSNTVATPAGMALLDAPYAITVDPSGNVYFDNEYIQGVGLVAAGSLTNYAGQNGSYTLFNNTTKPLPRATAGTFAIGSNFGITADSNANVYITDNLNGVIWRVDSATKTMYAIAGTEGTVCSTVIDAYGDGCPASQATFGKSGTSYSSSGVYGVYVDPYSDLLVGDSITNTVRKISSGTQFGAVGANQPTQTVEIHYAANDGPAAVGPYTLTAGATNFALGTPGTCTANADLTMDCLLPVTATPTVLGPFTGTLTVFSKLGKTANFPLNGTYVTSPYTRTSVSVTTTTTCSGAAAYSTTAQVTVSATVVSTGSPVGSVAFYNNGSTTPFQTVALGSNGVASFTQAFPAGSYSFTATFTPSNTTFKASSSVTPVAFSTSLPSFAISAVSTYQQNVVAPGQTALYSFTLTNNVYAGSISFACSGLPAGAVCVFSPSTLTSTGCSATNTVALSITTQQALPVKQTQSGFGGTNGPWQAISMFSGLGLALLIGLRRRRLNSRLGSIGMAVALLLAGSGLIACGKGSSTAATPAGSYTVTVTATGNPAPSGTPALTLTVPLIVN